MAKDFAIARVWAREIMEEALFDGAHAIDATMGNGHDTQWLCEAVGESGSVDAFDIQAAALESTRALLQAHGLAGRARLHLLGHEHMAEAVTQPADGIVFNLGWLPGSPHETTTRVETTLQAVNAACALLKKGGLLTVCVYPGHPEGARELALLLEWGAALDSGAYDVLLKRYWNQPNDPPVLLAVRRR